MDELIKGMIYQINCFQVGNMPTNFLMGHMKMHIHMSMQMHAIYLCTLRVTMSVIDVIYTSIPIEVEYNASAM
jgi:hypothetical protein